MPSHDTKATDELLEKLDCNDIIIKKMGQDS